MVVVFVSVVVPSGVVIEHRVSNITTWKRKRTTSEIYCEFVEKTFPSEVLPVGPRKRRVKQARHFFKLIGVLMITFLWILRQQMDQIELVRCMIHK